MVKISYPESLPISAARDELKAAILQHQVVVVGGETGSGKTTQIPKLCLDMGRESIGHTQPRRIAARTVAARIASELEVELGGLVGYKMRFADRTSPQCAIKLMTDGILLAETQSDRDLRAYDTIIIDEAHERSLNIDFLLGYLKLLLPRRPDLRLIITSATIDLEGFAKHFDAPILEVSGRTYPVEVRYRPPPSGVEDDDIDLPRLVSQAVDELAAEDDGDILVFLSGEREIRDVGEALKRMEGRGFETLPLYARLSSGEQDRIWRPHEGRRIVLATNVAETSLTVPGIKYVIDPGFARISRYGFRSKVQRLPIERVSRASADQRKGRCGRVEAGVCIRLYSEEIFLDQPAFTEAEILRTNLASVILQMKALDLGLIEDFPFVDPPDRRQVKDGLKLLYELDAIDEAEDLTVTGERLARLPLDPRLGRMLLAASEHRCLKEMLVIASGLSVHDPRERPATAREAADEQHSQYETEDSDFLALLAVWRHFHEQQKLLSGNQLRKKCKASFLNFLRLREWQDVHRQLRDMAGEMHLSENKKPAKSEQVHRAILVGLLGNLGQKSERNEYLGARGTRFSIFPGSGLYARKPEWVMSSEIVETSRLYARMNARIEPEWAIDAAPHLVKRKRFDPHWDERAQHVSAFEKVTLYGLPLCEKRRIHFGDIDPVESRHIMLRALAEGSYRPKAAFLEHNEALMKEVEELEKRSRRRDVLVDLQTLYDFYDFHVPHGIHSGKLFREWLLEAQAANPGILKMNRGDLMQHEAAEITERTYPTSMEIAGTRLPLEYHFEPGNTEDGITLELPIGALPRANPAQCEWLVPGLLKEKVLMLIRTLPKQLRRNLVPAPDVADRVIEGWEPAASRLLPALSARIREIKGVNIPVDAWRPTELPDYLRMNFRIVNDAGKLVDTGRDLTVLQDSHSDESLRSITARGGSELEKTGLSSWSFKELPAKVTIPGEGVNLVAFPALVDEGSSVALRLQDSASRAKEITHLGMRRLWVLENPEEAAWARKRIPGIDRISLVYSRLGKSDRLKEDILLAAVGLSLVRAGRPPTTEAAWRATSKAVRGSVMDQLDKVAGIASATLEAWVSSSSRVQGKGKPERAHAHADIQDQLEHLVYAGFIAATPSEWLPHLPRYMNAILARLEKLKYAADKDAERTRDAMKPWQGYKVRAARLAERGVHDANLIQFRWMIEEYRVSVFAQELGTAHPTSVKRLEKLWKLIQ